MTGPVDEDTPNSSPAGLLRQEAQRFFLDLLAARKAGARSTDEMKSPISRDDRRPFTAPAPETVQTILQDLQDEFAQIDEYSKIAEQFIENGPHTLKSLQAAAQGTGDGAEPPKGYCDLRFVAGTVGPEDVVRIPILFREAFDEKYQETSILPGKTVAEWLWTKPFAFQRDYGIRIMRELGFFDT